MQIFYKETIKLKFLTSNNREVNDEYWWVETSSHKNEVLMK